ncbi:MAG TPA: AMP-binding protein [Allosphingosinicella sp.]
MSGWAVPDYVRLHAAGPPGRLACVDLASGRRWTYAELDRSIACCVSVLVERRIGAGDRVAVLARNSAWQLILQQALTRLGAIFAPLNWRLAASELDALLDDCEPVLLVVDDASAPLADACAQPCERMTMAGLAAAIDCAEPAPPGEPADADVPSILLFTSGTSGRAKGVIVTERNAFFTATNFSVLGRVDNKSVFLCDSPMFHVIGLLTSLRPPLMQGGTIYISAGFDPAATLARLGDPGLGITHYFCVPQMAQMLRSAPGFDPARLGNLRALFTGGAPNPPENIRLWLGEGVRMADGFGMTEAGTVLGMPVDGDVIDVKAGSAGLPAPTLSLRIVGEDGAEVPAGEVGELQIRGPNVTPGYWRRPAETEAAFTQDGWFRTGDLGRRDSDGFVFLVDRRKDMFISGGENVYPAEVERVLAEHPAVLEAAVIGVASMEWGEVGSAFLVCRPGEAPPAEELEVHCRGRLARYKVPRSFRFVESLPRTASGKVMKQALRSAADAD